MATDTINCDCLRVERSLLGVRVSRRKAVFLTHDTPNGAGTEARDHIFGSASFTSTRALLTTGTSSDKTN